MTYHYTNYHLHRCWMYIFSWRYSPVSRFDTLNLARDSLLKWLCCYFLLFLGRLLASLLYSVCVCVCVCVCVRVCVYIYRLQIYRFFWYWHRKLFSNLVQVNNLLKASVLIVLVSHLLSPHVRCAFFSPAFLDCSSSVTRWNLRYCL